MRVLVAGGGISGLMAGWLAKKAGHSVLVMEPGKLGGGFGGNGLQYFHSTDNMLSLMSELGQDYSDHYPIGGILLGGHVHPYPRALKNFGRERADRIRRDHYFKTRRTEPDAFGARAMNDPSGGPKKMLRCDTEAIVRALSFQLSVAKESIVRLDGQRAYSADGSSWSFDVMITTLPLWIMRQLADFALPEAVAMKLNVVDVDVQRDPYAKWDYVYTPYTPENLIHRISPTDGGYSCEFNGRWEGDTDDKLTTEINFLFSEGWAIMGVKKNLPGHLLPLGEPCAWPDYVKPVGRFACWDPRMTADVALDAAIKIVEGL